MEKWKYRHYVVGLAPTPYPIVSGFKPNTIERMARIAAVYQTDKTILRMMKHSKEQKNES